MLLEHFIKRVTNRVFLTIFIFFVIAMIIPTTAIGLLSIKHSTNNIIAQISQSNADIQQEKMNMLEKNFEAMFKLTNQIAVNSKMWDLVGSKSESVKDQFLMLDIIGRSYEYILSNELIESIYFFDNQYRFILSSGRYNKADFPDQDIFDLDMGKTIQIMPRRFQNKNLISYIRKFNNISGTDAFFCVVNIKSDIVFPELVPIYHQFEADVFLIDDEKSIIFSKGEATDDLLEYVMEMPYSSYTVYTDKSGRFLVYKTKSEMLKWTLIYTQPYYIIVQSARLRNNIISTILIIIIMLSFIFAYLFSMRLYKPVSELLARVKNRYGIKASEQKNDYMVIEDALKKLYERGNEFGSKYQIAFPYFLQYSTIDLLTNNSFDASKYAQILNLLETKFIHKRFIVALMDLENADLTIDLKQSVEEELHVHSNMASYILTSLNSKRLAVIMNTDYDIKETGLIFTSIKDKLKEAGIAAAICRGRMYDYPEQIPVSYIDALNQIENKYLSGKSIIAYEHGFFPDQIICFSKGMKNELINSIMGQNRERALSIFEQSIFPSFFIH